MFIILRGEPHVTFFASWGWVRLPDSGEYAATSESQAAELEALGLVRVGESTGPTISINGQAETVNLQVPPVRRRRQARG